MLQLSLFGPLSLRRDGREIRIKSAKLRAIFGYIALSEPLQETRERLVGLLWSESEETQARAVLRQVIRELRDVFVDAGCDGLNVTAHDIRFERDAIDVDAWAVIHAAEAGDVHPLLLERPCLTDDLLAGLDDLDSSFRVWLQAKRHTMCDRLLRALEKGLAQPRDPQQESRLAEAILNLDPTHEDACRRLMHVHAAAGRTSHALRIYKSLWDLLDEDYGMEPSAATQKLIAEIKMGDYEPAVLTQDAGIETPANPITAIPQAVLSTAISPAAKPETRILLSLQPVDIQQVDSDKAHLVVGFRQFLIASLVKFREWHVTDAPFLERSGPEQEKAARYVIQMFAYQAEQAIQLTLMLKEVDTGFYIWSDGFELSLDNWFASQRRVIRRIAMALNVHMSAERLRRLSEQPDISLGVYDRWLRYQTLVRTFDPQHWDRLTTQFTEIIAAAPQFVPAYCGFADIHTIEHIAHPGVLRSREREQKALQLARKAVELDAADIHAHRCLAWAHVMTKQFGQAELHMQVACELNPNDSWTAISAALLSAFCGNPKRASELGQIALDTTVSPSRTHWAYQTDIEFLNGNYTAALEAADQAQDVLWGVAAWRTAALAQLGRKAEAAAEGARFLSRVRANWFGAEPATDEAIVGWLLHLYPIRRRADWERLRDGLQAAGLPTGGAEYDAPATADAEY
ncbi:DNA-binding transcriptional activator of the SARP family [Afipia sp. GAS231]|nr:DNA-binding transcriptional activator of the SARP family [Afipia sp. GAS231]